MKTKPKAARKMRARLTPIVECTPLARSDSRVTLDLLGQVIPARRIVAQSRVSGEIIGVHSNWLEGGRIDAGAVLVRLDPADYQIALTQAESELAQAESDALLERGRQDVAREEWQMLSAGVQTNEEDKTFALRMPQQKAAEARVASAQARVARARLDLERTEIRAPFNAVVIERHANLGDQASVQSKLATLADTDRYHVRVSIPVDELKWVVFPGADTSGSPVDIHLQGGESCSGIVIGRLEDLEPNGRMARLLVEVTAPMDQGVPLLINSFVRARVMGRDVQNAYAIDRSAFRDNSHIWLVTADNTLRILPVVPVWTSLDQVVFRAELAEGERLITSALGVAIDGMDLRVAGEDEGLPVAQGRMRGPDDRSGGRE